MRNKNQEEVNEVIASINSALKSRGGRYSTYSCKKVSWDDVSRGTVGGGLSCWGSNITDTYLKAKDGRSLFTVRSDNWNETLGKTNSEGIAFVGTKHEGGGGTTSLRPYTLKDFLKDPKGYGGYAGLNVEDLSDDVLDKEISVRFQTTFLPVPEGKQQKIEFATEAYNYNTRSDSDPRNLVLLCTSQGLAVQQDGSGAKKLYHHAKNSAGEVKRYWLEAESTSHKVGGEQKETSEEREDAVRRGKATASVIGTQGCGTRFNVLMTVQVPLKQKPPVKRSGGFAFGCNELDFYESGEELACCGFMDLEEKAMQFSKAAPKCGAGGGWGGAKKKSRGGGGFRTMLKIGKGTSSAARVSRGTEVDEVKWSGLDVDDPKRHPSEHITVTIVMYYVVQGGAPTEDDVVNAVDDLEELYGGVGMGKLADEGFDFMKKELTVKDVIDIKTKVETQPPPKPEPVSFFSSFPSWGGSK